MLLRYGTKNHLSLCDYQEVICLAASGLKDNNINLLRYTTSRGGEKDVLPVIAMYGANAAGKSNMIDALRFLFYAAADSYDRWRQRKNPPHPYCKVDGQGESRASAYDCDVIIQSEHYHYGFSIARDGVEKEWLYAYTAGPKKIIFERDFSNESKRENPVYFGPSMGRRDQTLKNLADSRKYLFLSAARSVKHETLSPITDFFDHQFALISGNENMPDGVIADELGSADVKNKVEAILGKADFGISGIQISSRKIDDKQRDFHKKIALFLKDLTGENEVPSFPDEEKILTFVHKKSDGSSFRIGRSNESSGTIHLLFLLAPIISALKYGRLVVLDEITTSLHTNLSKEIVKLFSNKESNPKNAQLIFSTHDTNLLSCGVLRRDSIWFAEKDRDGKTCIYPLTDFKVRKGENIEKGYLQGRFGAIPFIGDIQEMFS